MAIEKRKSKLIKKVNLAESFWLFTFEFDTNFMFLPGQYVSIKVAENGMRRSYSIASEPRGKTIELLVDLAPMGVGCTFLSKLNEGDVVEHLGPLGLFTMEKSKPEKKLLFVGTGSGIAPLRSMVRDCLITLGEKREIYISWGMRFEKDLFWLEEWEELRSKYSNFKYDIVLSKPEGNWQGCQGHVNDCITKHVTDLTNWEAYICGGKPMVEGMKETLKTGGLGDEDIHFEKFF